ncbi:MAG TPA: hypothetical protein VFN35_04995 [Ktedonobacteraceae bacterium]|nr:hypothetical protein [Ktedonobacteraceae bacterium]
MEEKKQYQQCAGPNCTNMIEQVHTGRGHRQRLYCHKNCCMAATRERQRLAAAEAERQRLLQLEQAEKEELQRRYPKLLKESIELLHQMNKRYGLHIVSVIGSALMHEHNQALEQEKALKRSRHLVEIQLRNLGRDIGYPAFKDLDIEQGEARWWVWLITPEHNLNLLLAAIAKCGHACPEPVGYAGAYVSI